VPDIVGVAHARAQETHPARREEAPHYTNLQLSPALCYTAAYHACHACHQLLKVALEGADGGVAQAPVPHLGLVSRPVFLQATHCEQRRRGYCPVHGNAPAEGALRCGDADRGAGARGAWASSSLLASLLAPARLRVLQIPASTHRHGCVGPSWQSVGWDPEEGGKPSVLLMSRDRGAQWIFLDANNVGLDTLPTGPSPISWGAVGQLAAACA
jgi:hypothetical protein